MHRYIFFHTCRRGLEVLGFRVLWMSLHHPFLRTASSTERSYPRTYLVNLSGWVSVAYISCSFTRVGAGFTIWGLGCSLLPPLLEDHCCSSLQTGPMQALHKDLCLVILIFGGWGSCAYISCRTFQTCCQGLEVLGF